MTLAVLHLALGSVVDISSPKGPPWEFLVVFATLLLGPVLFKRAGVPGIIGLLLGGYVIGPHGVGLIGSGNDTLPNLGQLGLLYLMFLAGVELDLNLLRKHRRSTVVFGLLTFALPLTFGVLVGVGLGWETAAAILLGSLLASHTLITYTTVRDAGLAADPAVATVVGSTVLTDTLALVVLAGVAGSVGGEHSGAEVAAQIAVGLIVLVTYSLLVLPLLAGWAFRLLGAERSVRYVIAITAFLSAATVAELFGIEGIVGAFFAGLALNRLVPNEGQLMDRIEFFGGAVFIPVFLVSVGLILNPAVMVESKTLELAGLLIVACIGGKILAALISARLLDFSRPQATLLFSLSSAQARPVRQLGRQRGARADPRKRARLHAHRHLRKLAHHPRSRPPAAGHARGGRRRPARRRTRRAHDRRAHRPGRRRRRAPGAGGARIRALRPQRRARAPDTGNRRGGSRRRPQHDRGSFGAARRPARGRGSGSHARAGIRGGRAQRRGAILTRRRR